MKQRSDGSTLSQGPGRRVGEDKGRVGGGAQCPNVSKRVGKLSQISFLLSNDGPSVVTDIKITATHLTDVLYVQHENKTVLKFP